MPRTSRGEHQAEARPWGAQDGLLRRVVATGARLLGGADQASPGPGSVVVPPLAADLAPPPAADIPPNPAIARAAWADRLWGDGMAIPGGAEEVLRLAALLPLTPAHTVLLAGLGARAAGGVVAGARGCFVSAHEVDLVPAPPGRRALSRRVTAATLSPGAPSFRAAYHQHALLLEPFRAGGAPERLLRATAAALRDGGEVVLLDLVASGRDADARWLAAEARQSPPPEAAMPEALEKAGFRIHVVEDAGARQQRAVMLGWITLLEALRMEPARPTPQAAAALVAEAEAWLLRLRLLRDGRLRLLRWHASLVRRPG
ncbi:hypothetical protein AAFN86_10430 [Roseomonas sp. CAU 1739]|uniref:hypothetical protein n=1 Tax=Roseomonas sp. CAU 1739 TaxID=3140364 RepID=UPI00325B9C6A